MENIKPGFKVVIYDDNDCILFLEKNFDRRYVDYFKKITYGPIKCDFWRACKLYIHGGVYRCGPNMSSDNIVTSNLKLDSRCRGVNPIQF